MKPVVGIALQTEIAADSFGCKQRYVNFLENAGCEAVILTPSQSPDTAEDHLAALVSRIDGVLLPGGSNVNPALYGEPLRFDEKELSATRDAFEAPLAKICAKRDIPLLGICRGLQLTNVALGGTLYQNAATEMPTDVKHWEDVEVKRPAHRIRVQPGGILEPLARATGSLEQGVNSVHRQGVKELAPALRLEAIAEDGLAEAASLPDCTFFLAVQWHPEFWPEAPFSQAIGRAFAAACAHHQQE